MISTNEARPHLWTDIIVWRDRKRRYLYSRAIVDELTAAKQEAFSRSQGESALYFTSGRSGSCK